MHKSFGSSPLFPSKDPARPPNACRNMTLSGSNENSCDHLSLCGFFFQKATCPLSGMSDSANAATPVPHENAEDSGGRIRPSESKKEDAFLQKTF